MKTEISVHFDTDAEGPKLVEYWTAYVSVLDSANAHPILTARSASAKSRDRGRALAYALEDLAAQIIKASR